MSAVPVFRDLSGDDDPEVTEIESFCINCYKNGITRLLLTRIPHYKNVVIMSFSCEECGYENNEIQSGGAFAEVGVRWHLDVETAEDLNRQVAKSDYTRVVIPEVEFEVPSQSQKGEVTTVEGILARMTAGLSQDQDKRRVEHPETAGQIDSVLARLHDLRTLRRKWTLQLEDISGNTFIENPYAPHKDPRCRLTHFTRTVEHNHTLGIFTPGEVSECAETRAAGGEDGSQRLLTPADPATLDYDRMLGDEVMQFRTNCPECNAPADTNMKITEIPHFKEVVIMATVCDVCGHKTNEVKSGGGVEEKGVKFEVRVAGREDFSRDILKSETCSMSIPELELEVGGRALGGRFTTVEGLLTGTLEQLRNAPGVVGDSPLANKEGLERVISKLEAIVKGDWGLGGETDGVTIVLDDPAGNSYVQSLAEGDSQLDAVGIESLLPRQGTVNVLSKSSNNGTQTYHPLGGVEGLKVSRYERSFEQNEELGLNDMVTEGYEES